jgi:predicted anti-sigma-YlaC factor YlaD
VSDPSCRNFRELLGVYVVGAIEPAERAAVDAHLSQCYECREELAALAPLPALLHRVPLAEAERIGAAWPAEPDPAEPSAEILDGLLKQVAARRRTRRFRSMFTAAAAVLIAVGGAAAVTQSLAPHPSHASFDVATARAGRLGATVHYGHSKWDTTTMSVQVTGFKAWTSCKFWVITKDGKRQLSGGWLVGPGAEKLWYPIYSQVPESSVRGFEITWGSGGVLHIPAS